MKHIIFILITIVFIGIIYFFFSKLFFEKKSSLIMEEKFYEEEKYELKEVKLFFGSLIPLELQIKNKKIYYKSKDISGAIKQCIYWLIKIPTEEDSYVLDPNTELNEVFFDDETVYLDFSNRNGYNGGTYKEILSITAIVYTILENFPTFKKVQILIEGEERETLFGHIDISSPFNLPQIETLLPYKKNSF